MGTDDPPANYGQSSHGLRGDYSRMRPDYTVDQDYDAYTEEQQNRWRRLYRRQIELVPGRACAEYVEALEGLDYEAGLPRFETVNDKLGRATGWQLVAVPGLVPDPDPPPRARRRCARPVVGRGVRPGGRARAQDVPGSR